MPVLPTAPPVKPKKDSRLTDLAIIGVPPEYRDQYPQSYSYPAKFSDEAYPVWEGLLSDGSFVLRSRSNASKDVAWHMTILEFLARCNQRDTDPFMMGTPTAQTARFRDIVRRGRIYLTEYVNEIGLFTKMRIQYAHREYIRRGNGIVIYSWARMFPVLDPTLPDWLTSLKMPRFIKHQRNRMVAAIRPGIRLWVDCINLHRVVVGQEIDVEPATIDIPGNATPTREEVDAFIDQNIWMPLVRSIRFDNVDNRLF